MAKVETSPGQTFGKSGMHGIVMSDVSPPIQVLGETGPFGKQEPHYELVLWWPYEPDRKQRDSLPESFLISRSE